MKSKIILTGLLMILSLLMYGQWTDQGTILQTDDDIKGSSALKGAIRINSDFGTIDVGARSAGWAHIYTNRPKFIFNKSIYTFGGFSAYNNRDLKLQTNGTTRLTILKANGRVGIGTANPQATLEVTHVDNPNLKVSSANSRFELGVATCNGCFSQQAETGDIVLRSLGISSSLIFDTGTAADYGESFKFVAGGKSILTINDNSKVDICGDVRANEVKVESNWCDYVFAKDYKMPTLEEEASFIKENGHLLSFESEEEMSGEIQLGDVTKRQQETIEKLMLHLIEMDQKIKELEEKVK